MLTGILGVIDGTLAIVDEILGIAGGDRVVVVSLGPLKSLPKSLLITVVVVVLGGVVGPGVHTTPNSVVACVNRASKVLVDVTATADVLPWR